MDAHDWGKLPKPAISLHGQPSDESRPTLLWDGEWEITWVTFRDMGAAFGAAILGIYVLVVAQFRSFRLPLVILTPIPLTLIGILIGHWLLGAPFTATSMIGFIALAGIIVRNSILLVDFIRHSGGDGKSCARWCWRLAQSASSRSCSLRLRRHDRCGDDPARSDLSGAGDLAPVRARLLDAAHRAGDPRDLHRLARAARGGFDLSQIQLMRIPWTRTTSTSPGTSPPT
ncbi:efflux RND transporter permease subunit [Bradyrhizobium betae]